MTFDVMSGSRDGRVVALAIYDGGGIVFDAEHREERHLLPQRDTRDITVSPDGRWVVTRSHNFAEMKVWESRTGRLVRDLAADLPDSHFVLFSPDNRWLAVGRPECWDLVETGTWIHRMRLSRRVDVAAFSPDSAILALQVLDPNFGAAIALVELATGREVAQLQDPEAQRPPRSSSAPMGHR